MMAFSNLFWVLSRRRAFSMYSLSIFCSMLLFGVVSSPTLGLSRNTKTWG
jgi:hypothetical protein